jgi:hypothetical protein
MYAVETDLKVLVYNIPAAQNAVAKKDITV